MNKKIAIILFLTILFALLLTACDPSSSDSFLMNSYTPWETAKKPTCAEEGIEKRTNIVSGDEETRSIPVSDIHGDGEWRVIAAYCTEEGEQQYFCSVCGEAIKSEKIAPVGHDFGEWTISKEKTCFEDGEEKRVCPRCGVEETKAIPASHEYGEWQVVSEATCDRSGTEERVCAVCGGKEVREISANGHRFSEWKTSIAPSCVRDGEEVRHCLDCGQREQREIKALGHEYSAEWFIDKEPTCTENGTRSHHCVRCGTVDHESTESIPARHVVDTWTTVREATCTEKGLKEGTCTRCGMRDQREIAEKGHFYSAWETIRKPSCTTDGEEVRFCTVCNIEERRIIAAYGHSFTKWEKTTEPTCEEEGMQRRCCSVCGQEQNQKLEALGHSFEKKWTIDIPATCLTGGSRSHHCKREGCSARVGDEQISATGHIDEDCNGYCDHLCGQWMVNATTDVRVKIDDKIIFFRENDENLTYSFLSDEPKDELDIRLSREQGNGVGEYAIIGQWNHNPYYTVTFEPGNYYIIDSHIECEYRKEYDGYFVIGYNGSDVNVKILDKHTDGVHGIKNVIGIDTIAFKNNIDILSVSIGRNVEYIGNGVFSGCTGLQKITFKDTNGWYKLRASDLNSMTAWKSKQTGEEAVLADENTNAYNFVNSDEYVDYYWYKR